MCVTQIKKLQEDADGHKAAASEYSKGLDTLSRGALSDVQRELADTVRRMAVVQVRVFLRVCISASPCARPKTSLCTAYICPRKSAFRATCIGLL